MQRNFCDQCGIELLSTTQPNVVIERITGSLGHLGFEIIVSQNGKDDRGEYCSGCVFDAVRSADKRPRPVVEE